ncbi:interferon tau-like, partial [Hemicordylus capensis]|uniref:interferon tau-like n=1 Tax=Hemicordylus capensis TaxID=884348 RepID=UPI002304A49F
MALQNISLLLLLASGIIALDCDHILQNQKCENQRNRELLRVMGRKGPPQECLYEMPDFGFPVKKVLGSSKGDGRLAMGFILKQISNLFLQNVTQAEWDINSLLHFRVALLQQSAEWDGCLTGKDGRFEDPQVKLYLLKYFKNIHSFLKDKRYSLCAWEAVRQEMQSSCFPIVLDRLTKRLR